MKMKPFNALLLGATLWAALISLAASSGAAEATAFELAKLGNDYVGKESKDKVVQIRSEKSIASTTPTIWYVVYYDADATFKATEVKFGAGKKMKVTRPMRILETVGDTDRVFDLDKLKIDSDQALKIARAEELLKPLTVRASQLWLQQSTDGPVWKVKLWAAKLKNPAQDADIGDVFISAKDGKVTRSELHINRVD
jgi:hypothetical protein